jgi:4-amino-4-deoxy-L-arabinose transferase-like glycosyltransferase
MPSAFFVSLGVYLFLHSELKLNPQLKSKLFYVLSGISIGIGYLIRESALLIGLFFLVYAAYFLFFKRQIKTEHFLVAAGVLLIITFEIFIFYKLTGNPLYKYTEVQDYLLRAYRDKYSNFGRDILPQGLFHYPYMILTSPLISHFYILVIIAAAYFIFTKSKLIKKEGNKLALMWFFPILLYLSFGSASFFHYLPFKAEPRYLSIITMPAILLLAGFLTDKNAITKRVKAFVIIALLFSSLTSIYLNKDRNVLVNLRGIYSYLEKSNYKEIYIDRRSLQALDYISGYDNKMGIKEYPDDFKDFRGKYIIINNMMIRNLKAVGEDFPKEISSPPREWITLKEIGNKYEDKIVVYRVK